MFPFSVETSNGFEALNKEWTANKLLPDEIWVEMKKVWTETGDKIIGKKKSQKTKSFISRETLILVDQKRKARNTNNEVQKATT